MPRPLRAALIVLAGWLLGFPASADAAEVGFEQVQVPDPAGPPLRAAIWYPTAAAASPHRLELYSQDVALAADVAGTGHPLVVISHGNGGSLAGHYDTALALAHAGFVVAAMTHTGDNYRDKSNETRVQDRPRHVRATIDYVLSEWTGHSAVDAARIGVFGFSAGGFTALVAIGGKPDFSRIDPFCATHAETFTCQIVQAHGLAHAAPLPPSAWLADPRIKTAVIAAPALGFAFGQEGLRGVTVPVQLWAAADDHVLPIADYAEAVRNALPQPPEYHLVLQADHFDFLAPCSAELAQAAPQICAEPQGFDRAAFHAPFNAAVVQFFARTLAGAAK
jgi:predicted dienelactone hydrolase